MTTLPSLAVISATDVSAQLAQWADMLGPIGKYIGALVIFLIGKMIVKGLSKLVEKGLKRTGVDEKLSDYVGSSDTSISGLCGTLLYYVLLLFVLIFALDFAGLSQVTQPLNDLFGKFLAFIPNAVGAGIILFLGYFLAKVVKALLENVLKAANVEKRLGLEDSSNSVTGALSTAAFCLVLLFVAPAALATLGIKELSEPILTIVESITGAIPNILLACVLLGLGVLIARIARQLVTSLLKGMGADTLPEKVGLKFVEKDGRSVSDISGLIVFVSIIVLIGASAIDVLQIDLLKEASKGITEGYFNVLLAILILGGGLIAARFAHDAVAGKNALLATVVKYAIIVLTASVALQRTQIAPELTAKPYEFTIYALALALGLGGAIAIGLGGKEYVSKWLEKRS